MFAYMLVVKADSHKSSAIRFSYIDFLFYWPIFLVRNDMNHSDARVDARRRLSGPLNESKRSLRIGFDPAWSICKALFV